MLHREFEPPEELKDVIKCFWYNRGDFGTEPSSYDVMPDGYAEIIFHFGSLRIHTGTGLKLLPSPFLMGLLDHPFHFYTENRLEIIGVRCFPWTVFDLLGLPAGKEGLHTFEHPIAALQPILKEYIQTGQIEEAIGQVTQHFLHARAHIAVDSLLYKAGIALQKANGTLPVSGVAAAAHATLRTLERAFKQSSGHTVKDVSGLMRFEQARNRLWREPATHLAGLALELGYADQSHLSREFKRYSGTTPAAFARNARKRMQTLRNDFVAFVQA